MYRGLKSTERSKVKQFIQLTNCSEKIALNCLALNEWRLDIACDSFFTNPETYLRVIDRKKIENWFHKYSQNSDKILIDGCIQLLQDLSLPPNDRKVLILAERLRAQTQCEFTKQEFINGMSDMNCDCNQSLSQRLQELDNELTTDCNKLRQLYAFSWNYGKHSEQKTMDWESAVQYWNILLDKSLSVNSLLLQLWIQWVSTQAKAVTRDTWTLLFDFITTIDPQLNNYDFDGAWPTMIDEFVLWARLQIPS